MKSMRCSLGFHDWRDLKRTDETMGQSAIRGCLRCGKWESIFRLLHAEDGPMHPRVEAARGDTGG